MNESLLQVQRLRLVPRDDHLHVGDASEELSCARTDVPTLEIAADARAQRLPLADVADLAALVAQQVDAGTAPAQLHLDFKGARPFAAGVPPCKSAALLASCRPSRSSPPS